MFRPASSSARANAAGQDRIRLLIIEDDNVHRMIVKRVAAGLGFDVAEASNYERAVMLLSEHRFDCITLDLSIESHSGIEVLRHLRDIGRRIPVLVISGADQAKRTETALYAESMKFDILHVVKKPLDLRALQEALAELKAVIQLSATAKP
jgi:CheY-like chemotaxis protein